MPGSVWERFTLDPRQPQHAHMRASDADREVVNQLLGTAYAEGRISSEELDERTDRVATAKTLGELPHVLADLVAVHGTPALTRSELRAQAEKRYASQRRQALLNLLVPSLICWVIWFVLNGFAVDSFPWPIFVTVATGMQWARMVGTREDSIESIQRNLERRQQKRLAAQEKAARRSLPPGGAAYPPSPRPPQH